jgi:hypothetical protein
MALDSVDLISLLKRARKPVSETDTVEDIAALAESVQMPAPRPIARIEEQEEELEDLRAELVADEVLIQRILGLLYRAKKKNPNSGYISILDMEKILKVEREGASFVMSYMKTQKVLEMDDKSRMAITVTGIIYLRSVVGLQAGPAVAPLLISETDSAV